MLDVVLNLFNVKELYSQQMFIYRYLYKIFMFDLKKI